MTPRLLPFLVVVTAGCAGVSHEEVGSTTGEASVTWTNLVGVSASGSDLTKTSGTNSWNAGAVSVETLAGDGYVELTVGETGTNKAAGLSSGDGGQHHSDIDFALRFTTGGAVQVYEGGTLRGSFGTYQAGDRFRVEVRGGIVRYSRSGAAPFYTSAVAPSFTLLVDTALYTPGATINDVELVATALTWQNLVGVAASDDELSVTKTSATAGWNAGASSAITLTGDGFMEFVAADDTTAKAAGLSSGDSNRNFKDIDYCVRLSATGNIHVYEAGVLRGAFGKYRANDRFRVEVSGGTVRYSMNGGVPFYTSAVPPTFPLGIDTSFSTPGATLNDFALVEELHACPAYTGTGLVCTGTFVVDSPAALAAVATCARITGDLYIEQMGLAEVSLPLLEKVDGVLGVSRDPDLVRLRLPQLKEIGSGPVGSYIQISAATGGVDLSRLRTIRSSLGTSLRGSLPMFAFPCLDSSGTLSAHRQDGSNVVTGSLHVPRLREVGSPTSEAFIAAHMTAPRLERVFGDLFAGNIAAPVLTTVSGYVSSPSDTAIVDAPNLTDIGGFLTYEDADNLPSLQRVGGDIDLASAASIDLPSLVELGGTLSGTYNTTTVSILDLPALERAGGISLQWPSLQQVSLPSLQVTGGLSIQSTTAITQPVTLPSLTRVKNSLDAQVPMDLPVLTEVMDRMMLDAPVNAPALVSIRGDMYLAGFNGAVSFPVLASVGGITCSNGAATSIDLPALTELATSGNPASIDVRSCDNLTAFSAPLLQSIGGSISIILNDALTSIDFGSLTTLVGSSLSINRNPVLPSCYPTDIHDQLVASGWTGTATIYGNNGTGTCP